MAGFILNNPVVSFLKNVVGPSAIITAGMIGAGAVSTRLLAGTWFGFNLLWVALYVIPMVIFTLDSASRVGIMSGHRGMMDMIKTEISPALAWIMFLLMFLVNILINMSQMSVMVEAAYVALGISLPPNNEATVGIIFATFILTAVTVALLLSGGFKRLEKLMTGLLMVILICFIIVAIKGLVDWRTWMGLARGLVPNIPQDLPVAGSDKVRSGFTQLMAIAGQALPPTVFLSYGYLTSNAEYSVNDLKESFKKNVLNLGLLWGLFSVVVVVAGTTALHNVYRGNGLHFSQIENVAQAGQVITPALPGKISFLASRFFSVGLLVAAFTTMVTVALTTVYFCLDIVGMDWKMHKGNKPFRWGLAFWIVVPGLLSPFWHLPALLKAILSMAGLLILAPLAVAIIIFFINREKYMGQYTAGKVRNFFLGVTFLFSLYVVVYGFVKFINQFL